MLEVKQAEVFNPVEKAVTGFICFSDSRGPCPLLQHGHPPIPFAQRRAIAGWLQRETVASTTGRLRKLRSVRW
jgi:hypothetical protein